MLAVILDEGDPAPESGILGVLVDPLQDTFALLVGGMSLPREDELHRPPAVVHDTVEPIQVLEYEVRPLVLGEPAGKPDRQGRRVEHQPLGGKVRGFFPMSRPLEPFPLPEPGEELHLQPLVFAPEFVVRYLVDHLPYDRVIVILSPVRVDHVHVTVKERLDTVVQPRGQVDAVCDGVDRDLLQGQVGPEWLPHLPGDLAVPPRDAVVKETHTEGKRGHVEPGARIVRVLPERHELVPCHTERRAVTAEVPRHQVFREDVVGSRDRGMGGEDRRAPDLLKRLIRGHPGNEALPEPFEDGKRRVALV
ncbi:hypothetical protein DSECCO2_650520 [anaerobic digester metagenome]